jgi:LPXTG-motif cell wall-anchored protein
MHKNTGKLVVNGLKEKRSWFLVSFVILFITVVIIPIITRSTIREGFIIAGIVEVFFLVFINCMIDFSYLHDARKLGYYASKPMTDLQRINATLVINLIYTAVLIGALYIVSLFIETNIYMSLNDVFMVAIPWLLAGILTAGITGVLTGNTIAASLGTIINFTLPLSLLAIINYFFRIVEDITVGFSSNMMFNLFVDKVYRIDILYFVKYAETGMSWSYWLVLAGILCLLYGLLLWLSKRRKHERAGELVVSDGYKHFIAIIIATLLPIAFSAILWQVGFIGKVVNFLILFALAYYLINAVLEKSFRLSALTYKLFGGFIVFFVLFLGIVNFTTSRFEGKVPEASEISSIYVGNSQWIYRQEEEGRPSESRQLYNATEDFMRSASNVNVYDDPETIDSIIQLHRQLIKDQSYYYGTTVMISYYYHNGEVLHRHYNLTETESYEGDLDHVLKEWVNTEGFKRIRMPFIYEEDYLTDKIISDLRLHFEGERYQEISQGLMDRLDVETLRRHLRRDLDFYLAECDKCLQFAIQGKDDYWLYDYDYRSYDRPATPSSVEKLYYLEITFEGEQNRKNFMSIRVTERFESTFQYLETIVQ